MTDEAMTSRAKDLIFRIAPMMGVKIQVLADDTDMVRAVAAALEDERRLGAYQASRQDRLPLVVAAVAGLAANARTKDLRSVGRDAVRIADATIKELAK